MRYLVWPVITICSVVVSRIMAWSTYNTIGMLANQEDLLRQQRTVAEEMVRVLDETGALVPVVTSMLKSSLGDLAFVTRRVLIDPNDKGALI